MMENTINGIHHITAIAGSASGNYDFHTRIMGLRLVKKTVNFDSPETYHLYYGNQKGSPGTLLTFFPWETAARGRRGSRQVTGIGYSVPEKSLKFWIKRFEDNNVNFRLNPNKFGEASLTFSGYDGLEMELVVSNTPDNRIPWETDEVKADHAIKGFHSISIVTNKLQPTADILVNILGYKATEWHENIHRFINHNIETANVIDLIEVPGAVSGHVGVGSVHHVAFRVKNEETLMKYHDQITAAGIEITDKIDRNYFYSLYFREPGGVLFELATDNPGFEIDEPLDELGTHLKLPIQYEQFRTSLEGILPKLS